MDSQGGRHYARGMAEPSRSSEPAPHRLSSFAVLAYGLVSFGSTLSSFVLTSWILFYYSPPEGEGAVLISAGLIGAIRMAERILGAVIEPLIGHLSDKTNTRIGRRRPWILVGAPLMTLAFVGIWFPPEGLPTNDLRVVAHFAVLIVLFWAGYTAAVSPYLALLPELAHDERGRVRLSLWLAVFEVLANVVGGPGSGWLIGLGAQRIAGIGLSNGYQLAAVVAGMIGFAAFIPMLLVVREPPRTPAHEVHLSLRESVRISLKNPLFLPYAGAVSGYKMATASAVIGVPFLATQLMGVDTAAAGNMLAVIILTAVLAFPVVQRAAHRHGARRVFAWGGVGFLVTLPLMGTIGLVPGLSPMVHGMVLFAASGFSVACVLVLPRVLLAAVIDHDAATTGLRREAMYNGMSGVVEKLGEALSAGMVGLLFELFGSSAGSPLGLRLLGVGAASGVVLGLWSLSRYEVRR